MSSTISQNHQDEISNPEIFPAKQLCKPHNWAPKFQLAMKNTHQPVELSQWGSPCFYRNLIQSSHLFQIMEIQSSEAFKEDQSLKVNTIYTVPGTHLKMLLQGLPQYALHIVPRLGIPSKVYKENPKT